ncbi:hypothetical protein BJX76DRAFT_368567 [Aspergillus varians]
MHSPPNKNKNNPFHQYLRKLTAQTQLRSPVATPHPLPPRYILTVAPQELDPEYDDDYEDYEDATEYYLTPIPVPASAPSAGPGNISKLVTINLNSSIHIIGDGNTVTIASGQDQAPDQAQTQNKGKSTIGNTTSHPRSRPANTTAAIITALQRSGVLTSTLAKARAGSSFPDSASVSTTVEINIDAGVKVEGCRNLVCLGTQAPGAGGPRMDNYNARKRRAQSV